MINSLRYLWRYTAYTAMTILSLHARISNAEQNNLWTTPNQSTARQTARPSRNSKNGQLAHSIGQRSCCACRRTCTQTARRNKRRKFDSLVGQRTAPPLESSRVMQLPYSRGQRSCCACMRTCTQTTGRSRRRRKVAK